MDCCPISTNILRHIPKKFYLALGGSVGFFFALENAMRVILKRGRVPDFDDWARRTAETAHVLHAVIHGVYVVKQGRRFDRLASIELGFYVYECIKNNIHISGSDAIHHLMALLSHSMVASGSIRHQTPNYSHVEGCHAALVVASHLCEPFKDLSTLLSNLSYLRVAKIPLFIHFALYAIRILAWPLTILYYWRLCNGNKNSGAFKCLLKYRKQTVLLKPRLDEEHDSDSGENCKLLNEDPRMEDTHKIYGNSQNSCYDDDRPSISSKTQNNVLGKYIKSESISKDEKSLQRNKKKKNQLEPDQSPPMRKLCYAFSFLFLVLNVYWYAQKLRKYMRHGSK
jgi:hypothetical protein